MQTLNKKEESTIENILESFNQESSDEKDE
jgi:hypothetical protein